LFVKVSVVVFKATASGEHFLALRILFILVVHLVAYLNAF
jgi:hypothetical protein